MMPLKLLCLGIILAWHSTEGLSRRSGGGPLTHRSGSGTVLGWNDVNEKVTFQDMSGATLLGADDGGSGTFVNGPGAELGFDTGGGPSLAEDGGGGRRGTVLGMSDIIEKVEFNMHGEDDTLGFDSKEPGPGDDALGFGMGCEEIERMCQCSSRGGGTSGTGGLGGPGPSQPMPQLQMDDYPEQDQAQNFNTPPPEKPSASPKVLGSEGGYIRTVG